MDLEQVVEKMSKEDAEKFLALELPEELEKEAAAELAESEFQNALYAYGAMTADLEAQSEDAGEAGLSKEASEGFEAAEAELAAAIEDGVTELGLDECEDDVEMHKVAMASAALIFEGYCDQLEKLAKGKFAAGAIKSVKKHFGKAVEKGKALGAAAMRHGKAVAKHPATKHSLIAAGGAAAGYGAGKLMDKKASEFTGAELADMVLDRQVTLDTIAEGIEKLAARGHGMGARLAKGMKHLKHLGKKHGMHAAAGAGGAAAGYMAHKMRKKHE